MKKFRQIYYWLKIVRLSTKWIFKFNLGDEVVYQGKSWCLNQGVCAPRWTLCNGGECIEAYEKDFRKKLSLRNYTHSFSSGYRFYMGYWYDIWVREGVLPWMKACKIWGSK